MNIFNLSLQMIKNNQTLYKYYLAVLILTTAIFYNYLAVRFNPYLAVLNAQYIYADVASTICSAVLLFGLMLFLFHSGNFFYKLRFKEIGTYLLMGVSEHKVGMMFVVENMILGGISILAGLAAGLLFSRLFFMLLAKAMILRVDIPFYFSLKAVVALIAVMTVLQLTVSLNNYRRIKMSSLIDILNAAKMEQKMPNIRWFRGAAGVILIAAAYYLAMNILELPFGLDTGIMSTSLLIILFICGGTYLFFGSFLAIILAMLIRNKSFIYRGTRLVSYSNTRFRLGTHYRSLAMTAILCAGTFTAFCASLALRSYADRNIYMEAPYSITYMGQDEATGQKIRDEIENSRHVILGENQINVLRTQVTYQYRGEERTSPCLVAGVTRFRDSMRFTMPGDAQKNWQHLEVRGDETIKIIHSNQILSGYTAVGQIVQIQDHAYHTAEEVKLPFTGELEGLASADIYIVTDENYEKMRTQSEEIEICGINISDPENSISLVTKIAGLMKTPRDNLNSYAAQYEVKYYLVGSFYFMGLVMSVVFAIAAFGTMYYKILSDVFQDREQYRNLMKLGMTEDEIGEIARSQVRIAFVLPSVMGILHGSMAIRAMEEFMHDSFRVCVLTGVAVFAVMLYIFYRIILTRYRSMIIGGNADETL